MAAIILLKRSDSATAPADDALQRGEPAYTFATSTGGAPNPSVIAGDRLFIGVPDGTGSRAAIIGGEYYTKKMDHTPGVLQTTLASDNNYGTVVLVDSEGVIDKWRVDNLRFGENDSNTITTASGNLILNSQTGVIEFSGAVLDSISSVTADSATFDKITVTGTGANITVANLNVTDSANIAFFTADSAKIDSAEIDVLYVTDSAYVVNRIRTAYVLADSAKIGSLIFDGTNIQSTSDSGTITINPWPVGDSGEVIIKGNLRVDGTTTTINSTELTVNDIKIILGDSAGQASDLQGAGIQIGDSASWAGETNTTPPQLLWDDGNDRFDFNRNVRVNNEINTNTLRAINVITTGVATLAGLNVSDSAYIPNLRADSAHLVDVDIDSGHAIRFTADSITVTNLTVTGTTGGTSFTTLNVTDSAYINNLFADSAYIAGGEANLTFLDVGDSAYINNLFVDSAYLSFGRIADAYVDSAYITQLYGSQVDIDSASISNSYLVYADVDKAHIDSVDIDRLQVDSADITNLYVDSAHALTLSADSATFDILRITDSVGLKTLFDSTDFIFIDAPGKPQVALKAEAIEDFVGDMVDHTTISDQTNIRVTYDSTAGALDFEVPFATSVANKNSGSGIAGGAGVAKFADSDFFVDSNGFVAITQVDGGTF